MYKDGTQPIGGLDRQRPIPLGKVFYVDGNAGNNSNNGIDPATPFLTIAYALTQCVANRNDYIYVLDHFQEAFPISVNVRKIHIIGVAPTPDYVWLTAPGDTAIFTLDADHFEIAGFEFGAGATHAAIESGGGGYGVIHDCRFGWMQAGQDGIRMPAPLESPALIIEECSFGNNLTRDGIRIDHNMTRGEIKNNIFRSVPGVGVNVLGQMALGLIISNKFKLPGNVAGAAITLSAAAGGNEIYIGDNDANYGNTTMALIPWVVTGGSAVTCTWDNNRRNGVVVMPA